MTQQSSDEGLPSPPPAASLTYGEYLKVEELIQLQHPRSSPVEHDELLFIVIHQVYELWFRLLLHEGEKVRQDLFEGELFDAISTLARMRAVLKTLVSQLDVLETMTPLEFSSFRARLDMASGFQSAQFRELEFLLGYKREQMLAFHGEGTPSRERLERRLREPSIVDGLYAFLERRGLELPREIQERDITKPAPSSEALQRQLVERYRTEQDLVLLLEALTDIDEGIQEWRYRHVKMVERTIGVKMGTGGSAGADYLRRTLFKPLFPDLWAIRSQF
jgi:tryptophan 2,3-dioxygenase